jgi:hypothetical protein
MPTMTPQQAMTMLRKRIGQFRGKVVQLAEYEAAQLENDSKRNAPWTDRTGNARNSIYGLVQEENGEVEIVHGINIEYGKYLETKNEGRYRIIKPTVDEALPRIKKHLQDLGV